jgi:hypothetical protein
MAETISATFIIDAVPAVAAPSKTRPGRLTVSMAGLTSNTGTSVVKGEKTSNAAPATLADLTNTTVLTLGDWDLLNSRVVGGATYTIQATTIPAESGDSRWTAGHFAFVCLFDSATPSSGDAPVATAGPFLVVA